jgi:hypothetical protein
MDEQRATGSGTPTGSPSQKNFPRLSGELVEEVERLLARRTRNIRLSPELSQLFRERVWPQTAKIVQSWMLWVVVLDVLTLALNALLLPTRTVVSMLLPASMMIPAALLTSFAFVRRPGVWAQGAIILSGVFVIRKRDFRCALTATALNRPHIGNDMQLY